MTENQEEQIMMLLNKCVNGIQKLETNVSELKADVSELKTDVSEIKEGQNRIEMAVEVNNRVVNKVTGEQARVIERLYKLEQPLS
ncbi:MAG: hypothetical protein ACR2J3_06455 [Aridibacter sp.]